jgi:hypothetical protein
LNLSRLGHSLFVTAKLAFKRLAVLFIRRATAVGTLLKIPLQIRFLIIS